MQLCKCAYPPYFSSTMISSPARGQQCVQHLQQEGSSTGNQEFAIRSNVSRRQFSSCTAAENLAQQLQILQLWQKSRSGLCIWNLSVIIRATLRFITCDLSQQFKYNDVGRKENCKTRQRFCVNSNRNSFVLWLEGRSSRGFLHWSLDCPVHLFVQLW